MSCSTCAHFDPHPAAVEAAFPGLSSLSSAYAAVKAADGLCSRHERYVAASSDCTMYSSASTCTRQS
jgi:hypothetical protein